MSDYYDDLFGELCADECEEMMRISSVKSQQDWLNTQDWINSL